MHFHFCTACTRSDRVIARDGLLIAEDTPRQREDQGCLSDSIRRNDESRPRLELQLERVIRSPVRDAEVSDHVASANSLRRSSTVASSASPRDASIIKSEIASASRSPKAPHAAFFAAMRARRPLSTRTLMACRAIVPASKLGPAAESK